MTLSLDDLLTGPRRLVLPSERRCSAASRSGHRCDLIAGHPPDYHVWWGTLGDAPKSLMQPYTITPA